MEIDTIPGKDWDKYLGQLSNKQVLILALEKAEKNGMRPVGKIRLKNGEAVEAGHIYDGYYESIILSKEFAKAFFGDKEMIELIYTERGNYPKKYLIWQYHLQQMVLEDNRIAYLKKFL